MRTDYAIYWTLESANAKVGPIPVSTVTAKTCPDTCPLKGHGCYAENGPLSYSIWQPLSRVTPGRAWHNSRGYRFQSLTWSQYCDAVTALPIGQSWRHAQAGDLPGTNTAIDARKLRKLVKANKGKRGFTYTHKPVTIAQCEPLIRSGKMTTAQARTVTQRNAKAVAEANAGGFTINLSANSVAEIDALAALDIGPVVTVLPAEVHGKQDIVTPRGKRIVVCPATYRDDIQCVDCMLCQRQRDCAVGFPAHGAAKRRASAIAS